MAAGEYQTRHDIYGADAVAWTALKAGKIDAARSAIKDALQLGTKDPMLDYHAAMIALASNDRPAAIAHLRAALTLSPQFDPLQAPRAAAALQSLGATTRP